MRRSSGTSSEFLGASSPEAARDLRHPLRRPANNRGCGVRYRVPVSLQHREVGLHLGVSPGQGPRHTCGRAISYSATVNPGRARRRTCGRGSRTSRGCWLELRTRSRPGPCSHRAPFARSARRTGSKLWRPRLSAASRRPGVGPSEGTHQTWRRTCFIQRHRNPRARVNGHARPISYSVSAIPKTQQFSDR